MSPINSPCHKRKLIFDKYVCHLNNHPSSIFSLIIGVSLSVNLALAVSKVQDQLIDGLNGVLHEQCFSHITATAHIIPCLSWVSPVLGWDSEVSCPRTLPLNTQRIQGKRSKSDCSNCAD